MIRIVIVPLIIFFHSFCYCQKELPTVRYNHIKEELLNILINTNQFDSVYNLKRVYFVENELLSKGCRLVIKKGNCKALIKRREYLKNRRVEYVSLGDFTVMKSKSTSVRIQLYSTQTKSTLNVLFKEKINTWVISSFMIMED